MMKHTKNFAKRRKRSGRVQGEWFTCTCDNDGSLPTKKLESVNSVTAKRVNLFAKIQKSKQSNYEKVARTVGSIDYQRVVLPGCKGDARFVLIEEVVENCRQ
jgi:hypothetical protein